MALSTPVSVIKEAYIDVFQYSIKRAFQFTSVGWIKNPVLSSNNPLILLAVSNLSGNIAGEEDAVKMELLQDSGDYRLRFSNALSKKIAKTLNIRFDDDQWHFLSYVCIGEGNMLFYVDGKLLPCEDGVGPDGILYSVAWSRSVRQGGGDVWCPYLYEAGQAVSVFHWRFSSGVQLHQQWINELMEDDLAILTE